jgi:hypothetical protein
MPRAPFSLAAFLGLRRGALLAVVTAGSLAAGATVGSLLPEGQSVAVPSRPPATPPSGAAPRPTLPPTVPPTAVVTVPGGIEDADPREVTAALQAVIDGAPDGALIRFPAGTTYRIEGPLEVAGRTGLTIEGTGVVLIQPALGEDPGREIWRIKDSRSITLTGFRLEGANPDPGVFVEGFEWQHSVSIEGAVDTLIDRVEMVRPMGDCVYVAFGDLAWATGVWVRDSSCHGAARQGIAVVGGRDIRVERTRFGEIGLSVLDLEPEAGGAIVQGAEAVVFSDNVVDGQYGGRMFNATGVGPVNDVVVEGTRVAGADWGISALAAPLAGSPRYRDIVFRQNVGEGAFVGRAHAFLHFADIDNLVVSGNRQRIDSAMAAIHLERVCNVVIDANALNPVDRVTEEGGCG